MTTDETPVTEVRSQTRTNIFVAATIYAGGNSAPVKIRNLAPGGALIEGALIPAPGAEFKLCRGSLTIAGKIVWRSNGRAGLKFESQACVAHWLPGGESLLQQQQVDTIFQEIKASPHVSSQSPEPGPSAVTAPEMVKIKLLIESLAEDLAGDIDVIMRHGSKLQALDLAAQALGKLAAERD